MVPGISDEALLTAVAKRDQRVMDVHDSILALQDHFQAVENIHDHEDVQDIRKSARATARQKATKEAAAKKCTPPPSKTVAPTVVAEKKVWKMRPFRENTHWNIATARLHLPQSREQVQTMERRVPESCGPANGDEDMEAQDKVVFSAGAGVCSADRVAMAYNTGGGAMPI